MNLKTRQRYDLLVRVNAFGDAHHSAFPPGTLGGEMFAVVGACLRELKQHAVSQRSGRDRSRGAVTSKLSAREALLKALKAIRRTASAIALDSPGFDSRFPLPRGSGNHRLLVASRVFLHEAAPSAAAFVAHGMPSAFLDDLAARIARLEETIRERGAGRAALAGARANLAASLEAARHAVRRLDALVPNALGDDPGAMAAWRKARHVVRTARSRKQPVVPPSPGLQRTTEADTTYNW